MCDPCQCLRNSFARALSIRVARTQGSAVLHASNEQNAELPFHERITTYVVGGVCVVQPVLRSAYGKAAGGGMDKGQSLPAVHLLADL